MFGKFFTPAEAAVKHIRLSASLLKTPYKAMNTFVKLLMKCDAGPTVIELKFILQKHHDPALKSIVDYYRDLIAHPNAIVVVPGDKKGLNPFANEPGVIVINAMTKKEQLQNPSFPILKTIDFTYPEAMACIVTNVTKANGQFFVYTPNVISATEKVCTLLKEEWSKNPEMPATEFIKAFLEQTPNTRIYDEMNKIPDDFLKKLRT